MRSDISINKKKDESCMWKEKRIPECRLDVAIPEFSI